MLCKISFYCHLNFYLIFVAFSALSEQGIYVSRHSGHDTKTCGNVSFPCRTISYGIQQLSTELYIYLDGTDTLINPYTCKALDPQHPIILLNQSISFLSIKSRTYISCLHGNSWLADGTRNKDGIRITFSGLVFLNTSLRFFDAFLTVKDTEFVKTKLLSLYIQVVNLPRYDLLFNNVFFHTNDACINMRVNNQGSNVFVNITDTVFYQNGNLSSEIPSIFWLYSKRTLMNIQLRNCSFQRNTLTKYGIFFVANDLGTTNVLLSQLRLKENIRTNRRMKRNVGVFNFYSARVFMTLEYGLLSKTFTSFLTVTGNSAQINMSNFEVYEFYSATGGGGVVDLFQSDFCSLSIKDSLFHNGNNNGSGGVVSIVAPNLALSILNCSIHNVSSSTSGGAVYIQSRRTAHVRSLNRSKNFFVHLCITNSSFSSSASKYHGGVIFVSAEKLMAIVRDSSFERNSAIRFGGALFIYTNDDTTISLYNDSFRENIADHGGIVHIGNLCKKSSFRFSITNVMFVHNRLYSSPQDNYYGIVYLLVQSTVTTVKFKDTYFNGNLAERGNCIFIHLNQSKVHSVTLDSCIFQKNYVIGAVYTGGQASLTCKHSIFVSNGAVLCRGAIMALELSNSIIFVKNTTFVGNSCSQFGVILNGNSKLRMYDSKFVRNKNIESGGGALIISSNQAQFNTHFESVHIERVLFKENIARTGTILTIVNAEVRFSKCTFLNNFSHFQGGLIISTGSGSANLAAFHSVFRQTMGEIVIDKTKKFVATSFLRLFSFGILLVANTTFNQNTNSNEPLILVPAARRIYIDNASLSVCPLGRAIEKNNYMYRSKSKINRFLIGLTFSCKECDYNFYSLQRGTARGLNVEDGFQCLPCPTGADCVPAIKSKKNYWGYSAGSNPPKLAFTICPFGYCKSPPRNSTQYNACQGKRTGVMCGMCSRGYTEALWSTHCTPVKNCNDHWFWILFLALVFSMAIILVFKPPFMTYCLKQILWFRKNTHTANTFSLDEETPDKRQFTQLVEIIFYFYQVAQLLLSSSTLTEFFDTQFLEPILGFFNFQPSFKERGFLCPFPGLTPETKLVFKIAPVFGTLVAIFFIYGLHSSIRRMRGTIHLPIAPYLQASIKTIFLGYVTLATVSISLIRCVFVAGKNRWLYDGNITCYQWWQYLSFTFIAVFVIPFIFVLALVSFKLYHDQITVGQFILAILFPLPFLMLWLLRLACLSAVAHVEENQNVNALKKMLLAPYRQPNGARQVGALYWQSVLIARRFILVLIFCIITEPSIRLFSLTLACVFVFGCHLKVKPFENSLANNVESLSLLALVILGLINLFKSVFFGSERNIKGSLVTVFKVFNWLEISMLGTFPAVMLLLLFFAVISFLVRVLFICCKFVFKFLFKPCTKRWLSRDSTALLNVCNNTNDDIRRRDFVR